ncbi:hypothetical protein HCN44_008305 [Aphidius gifuensis]|uniref:Uncharacterized protein n=1 Tax=Aphidius gifuensis TaxID=684658 RepID=A0A834XP44_APHGI|nr:uncharacterized protein LOC122858009 [Aphidius gifuensis]KAF7989631.1 hypothetical protein HCN44_008305 [Aphidius gifuensis]
MQLITSSTRLTKFYISIYFVVILINNVSLSSGTIYTPTEDLIFPKLKFRDGGFISDVDGIEADIKTPCIPCNFIESTMKTIKSLIIDFEHLNKKHCTNVDSLAQKSKDIQRQEMKPESYYRRYGRGRPPPHFPPPYFDEMYRINLQTTTTASPPPPSASTKYLPGSRNE